MEKKIETKLMKNSQYRIEYYPDLIFCFSPIDICNNRAIYFDGPFGQDIRYDEVPTEHRAQREDLHDELVEHLVNADDIIGDIFLEEKTPTYEDVQAAIRRATLARKFTPVLVGKESCPIKIHICAM